MCLLLMQGIIHQQVDGSCRDGDVVDPRAPSGSSVTMLATVPPRDLDADLGQHEAEREGVGQEHDLHDAAPREAGEPRSNGGLVQVEVWARAANESRDAESGPR